MAWCGVVRWRTMKLVMGVRCERSGVDWSVHHVPLHSAADAADVMFSCVKGRPDTE